MLTIKKEWYVQVHSQQLCQVHFTQKLKVERIKTIYLNSDKTIKCKWTVGVRILEYQRKLSPKAHIFIFAAIIGLLQLTIM